MHGPCNANILTTLKTSLKKELELKEDDSGMRVDFQIPMRKMPRSWGKRTTLLDNPDERLEREKREKEEEAKALAEAAEAEARLKEELEKEAQWHADRDAERREQAEKMDL